MADGTDELVVPHRIEQGHHATEPFTKMRELAEDTMVRFGPLSRSKNDGRFFKKGCVGKGEAFFLGSGHGVAADESAAPFRHERTDLTDNRSLDTSYISHQHRRVSGKWCHLCNDFGHVPRRHRENEEIGPGDGFIDVGRSNLNEAGFGEELRNCLGTARPRT